MLSAGINRWLLYATLLLLPEGVDACTWSDTDGELEIEKGTCEFSDIAASDAVTLTGRIATATATIRVGRDATLLLDDAVIDELRLLSTPEVRANLIAEAATLRIFDIVVQSYDPSIDGPDQNMADGRSFLRVEAFVDEEGTPANGLLEIERSTISYLGYDSRYVHLGTFSAYGISLKVQREEELQNATVTGHIINSTLSHNYRGFYSYGAHDFEIRDSEIHNNSDYGIDGHDDTDRLSVTGNLVYSNGGTGLICSRRCDNSVFADNVVRGNGANGIVLHDISTGGRIRNNRVFENVQDGIVIHDSHNTLISYNVIHDNRYGLRIFAGSVATTVTKNVFRENREADIFVKHGNLDAETDLSDYSDGSKWNGQNIARHNSSRVWGTLIVENNFDSHANINVRGAQHLGFARNDYAAGVTFDIRSSDNVELDGFGSKGPVKYVLRAEPANIANYSIHPVSDAELSMTGNDRVRVIGGRLMIPQKLDFRLQVTGDGHGELTVEVADPRDVRTGVLTYIPISPVSGTATISRYRSGFAARRSIEMNINTDNSGRLRLTAFEGLCSSVKWSFDDRSFITPAEEVVEMSEADDGTLVLKCLAAK